jgi:ABC-type antimicrobial peptide transport system permease subunit
MNAIATRLAIEARHRWRAWLSLALLLALFGGAVMAAAAGARRTHSAYPRYLVAQRAFDQFLLTGEDAPLDSFSPQPEQLRAMPEVEDVANAYFFANIEGLNAIASGEPGFERTFNVPTAYQGRLSNPSRADEAMVPIVVADELDLSPGDKLTLNMVEVGSSFEQPTTIPVTFTVTAITVAPAELPPGGDVPPPIRLTRAFYERYTERVITDRYTLIRLHRAQDLAAFRERLSALGGGKAIIGFTQEAISKNVQRSFELQAATLWMLAVMLAAAGVAIFAQTLARQTSLEGEDFPVLRAVGMSRSQLAGLGIARAALIGLAGAAGAVLLAFLLSPLTPTGLGRAVETSPGLRFDPLVLGAGGGILVLLVILLVALPAWLAARRAGVVARAQETAPGSRVGRLVSRLSSPTVSTGFRFALEPGRGRTAVPVRSTLLGAAVGLAALTMAFTFGAGLNNLLDTPRLYGIQWDLVVDVDEENSDPSGLEAAINTVNGLPGVEDAVPAVLGLPFVLDGQTADALALREQDQRFIPPLLSGRVPGTNEEIVIGPKTSKLIGKGVGDSVEVTILGGKAIRTRVVGIGVLPATGHTGNLGEGTLVSLKFVEALFGEGILDELIVRLEPGASADAVSDAINGELGPLVLDLSPPQAPSDIVSFGRSENLPFVLAGVLTVMAAGTIAHLLVTGIARRRRDLAILKTVGFVRRQVAGTVAWQATVLTALALAVGIPVGVAAGRSLWTGYAESLGVLPVAVVPVSITLIIVPSALLLANLIAIYPARSAARTRPAIVLRSE